MDAAVLKGDHVHILGVGAADFRQGSVTELKSSEDSTRHIVTAH